MKKRCVDNKRALSPVIATVLLVVLVLVLAAIIFLWVRGFITEQIEKSGEAIENICNSVNFDANINNGYLEVVNRGTVSIAQFELKKITGGDSEKISITFPANVGESFSEDISEKLYSGETPDEVIVYPVLLGTVRGGIENKHFTCESVGKKLSL